ncbi:unnamed protein product [Prunus armeniaca]|uniref:Uncharacterized protein n=1 Tax=Prunus armeniaca TaxID=36596 RepID=A0A6J5VDH3_PRUAR|nr:unnamed protein product [Prunus armeniaca]
MGLVLEGLDPVRKRPGMYIGSTGPRGLHHLVYEKLDNAVDEAQAGFASKMEAVLLADGSMPFSQKLHKSFFVYIKVRTQCHDFL